MIHLIMLKEVEIKRSKVVNIFKKEWFQITLLTLLSISAPLIIKSPQILVGSIVNFTLTFSVLRLGFKKTLPSVIFPSLFAYGSNILFGGATFFLIYFLPIIFVGNAVYILLIKSLKLNIFNILISSFCKSIILFLFAYIFVNHFNFPSMFLSSMGYMQLITAVIGGYIGFFLNKVSV